MSRRREDQDRLASAMRAWPPLATLITQSEGLVAVARLRASLEAIDPKTILVTVEEIRKRRRPPTGPAYEQAFARRGGQEFQGGSVCWDPATDCDGKTCQACVLPVREGGETP